jgi:S1-C subfamily serine protease
MRFSLPALLSVVLLVPVASAAPPRATDRLRHPSELPALPSYVQQVAGSIVGVRVQVDADRPSAATLGTQRFASAVIFDARGYALTVSYVLLDADRIEVRLRDGQVHPGHLTGIDLETGLGVLRIEGGGPWAAATLADSAAVGPGDATATVGVDEDGDLVALPTEIQAVRRFAAYWEYMLPRAFLVAPGSPAFGGSAVVNARGEVVAIASLRLGQQPEVNLAIPTEHFLPVKDELLSNGRVRSRPPRPWLGLYTAAAGKGLVVQGVSPVGPAGRADFRKNDEIVEINGQPVRSQEEFYERLWAGRPGDQITLVVRRADQLRTIIVQSADRYQVYRTMPR